MVRCLSRNVDTHLLLLDISGKTSFPLELFPETKACLEQLLAWKVMGPEFTDRPEFGVNQQSSQHSPEHIKGSLESTPSPPSSSKTVY